MVILVLFDNLKEPVLLASIELGAGIIVLIVFFSLLQATNTKNDIIKGK
jgi:hypothetical protein